MSRHLSCGRGRLSRGVHPFPIGWSLRCPWPRDKARSLARQVAGHPFRQQRSANAQLEPYPPGNKLTVWFGSRKKEKNKTKQFVTKMYYIGQWNNKKIIKICWITYTEIVGLLGNNFHSNINFNQFFTFIKYTS